MKRMLKENAFMLLIYGIVIVINIMIISGCSERTVISQEIEHKLSAKEFDAIQKKFAMQKHDVFPEIKYRRVTIKDYSHRASLRGSYDKDKKKWSAIKTIETLNRQEFRFLRRGETIVLPDTIIQDMRAYSIFPQFWWEARHTPKIVLVSAAYQAYGAYEYGKLVHFAATNTGKERTQTYPGRYSMEWKEREHLSSLDSNWKMPYTINIHIFAGSAFHQFSMPGRPVSHSCCRQFMDDAKWLYYWGKGFSRDSNRRRIPYSGTPIIIMDYFDFSRKSGGPWLDLSSNKSKLIMPPAMDPMEYEEALIPWCQIPLGSRWGIKNKDRFRHAEDTLRARGVIRPHVKLIETKNFNQLRREKAAREARKKAREEANQKRKSG